MKKRYFCLLSCLVLLSSCQINNNVEDSLKPSSNSEISTSYVTSTEKISTTNSNTYSTSEDSFSSQSSSKNDTPHELEFIKTNIDYNESSEDIINPECGFYYPLYLYLKQNNNQVLNIDPSLKQKYSIIHLRVGLEAFSSKASGSDIALTNDALEALSKTILKIKEMNMSCIIRFSYNMQGKKSGNNYLEAEPNISLIKTHIKQISPILNEHKETMLTIESGMLGPWGEQHSTSLAQDENAIVEVMDTFLTNLDKSLTINVRYPLAFIRYARHHGITNASLENINKIDFSSLSEFNRIGMFNDGYMANHEDYGTYTNRENEVEFLYKQGQSTVFGGEVESATSEIINSYNTSKNVIAEAYKTHTTYLNDIYREEVINAWKNEKYDGNDKAYVNKSGYDYLKNHFGYRFVFKDINITRDLNNVSQGKLNFIIENRGFANLIKNKVVELILKNDNSLYKCKLDLDLTKIKSLSQVKYELDFDLPNLSNGNYQMYLKITTDGNEYLPIKFANKNIYDQNLFANYLGEIKVNNCLGNEFKANVTNIKASKAFFDTDGGKISASSQINIGKVKTIGSLINLNETKDIANVTMHKGSYDADNYLDIEISNYNASLTKMELSYYASSNMTLSAYEGSNWNDCLFYKHTSSSGNNTFNLDISSTAIYKNILKNKTSFILRLFLGHGETLLQEMNFTLKSISFYNPNGSEKVSVTYLSSNEYLGSEFYLYMDKNSSMVIKENYFVSDKEFLYFIDQNKHTYQELDNIKVTENLILKPVFAK